MESRLVVAENSLQTAIADWISPYYAKIMARARLAICENGLTLLRIGAHYGWPATHTL